jgi:DNA-binding NtrC family response regulator
VRVLIVDDEMELVETLVARLKRRGIEARGSPSGREALELVASGKFDVALVDVKMPGINGIELVRLLKERIPELPVVMLTGHGSAQHAEDGLSLGAYAYLMKPVKLPALLEVLTGAVKSKTEDS